MIKVAIVHPSLNVAAGAEKVSIKIIESLKELGLNVSLITIDKVKWELLVNKFITTLPDEEFFLERNDISYSTSHDIKKFLKYYVKLLLAIHLLKKMRGFDYTISTHGETLNFMVDIAYVNSVPLMIPLNEEEEWLPKLNPIKKVYTEIFNATSFLLEKKTFYISNSVFIRNILLRKWKINSIVINPPVNVDVFKKLSGNRRRKNIVITISRIKWNKGLSKIPSIARKTSSNVKFIIIGTLKGSSRNLIKYIIKKSKRLGVGNKVKILLDLKFSDMLEIISKAKAYLHTMANEAFGISIVESMAAGCVPIVPRKGGPWTDILDESQGIYGFAYENMDEAAYFIDNIIENDSLWRRISEAATNRSTMFSEVRFKEKIKKVILEKISM